MFSDSIAVSDCLGDEFFSGLDRWHEIPAHRQRGANCSRIDAAGSVRADTFYKRRTQDKDGFAVIENVGCATRAWQMTAFEQDGATEL